jgi:hypothetical protein
VRDISDPGRAMKMNVAVKPVAMRWWQNFKIVIFVKQIWCFGFVDKLYNICVK